MGQTNLLKNIADFQNRFRTRTMESRDRKEILMKGHMLLMKVAN